MDLGVTPARFGLTYPPNSYVVVLNGRIVGTAELELMVPLEAAFRKFKSDGTIGETTEYVYLARSKL